MNCIFCHKTSNSSKSIEHIIPESLGNKDFVLWKGAICDKCNNYFATKIEHPLLEQPYFVSVRHRNFIKTKKGHSVPIKIPAPKSSKGFELVWMDMDNDALSLCFENESTLLPSITSGQKKHMIVPLIQEPESNNWVLSRFLAKCAYEFLVYRIGENNFIEFSEHLQNEEQFYPLRKYARYGEGCKFWPYSQRRIYGEGDAFTGMHGGEVYEVLNEMDLLSIELERKTVGDVEYVIAELYFILVIMGVEYAINIAEPDMDGYNKWLQQNNFTSPVFRYGEKRFPNMSTSSLHITEELIRKMNDK
jgi:hypothetical protein